MQEKLGWGVSHQELYFMALCGAMDMTERNKDYVIKNYGLNMSMSSIPIVYASILEVLVFYLVNTVMSVIYVTVYIRQPDVGMQRLLGQTCIFRHLSPNSTIPRKGIILFSKGYHILDIRLVSQDQHPVESQETISHQTDLELELYTKEFT